MVRVGIIGCQEVMKAGCAGTEACTNCYKAAKSREGEFSRYNEDVEIVALGNCGGCPGRRVVAKSGLMVKNLEIDAIHLSSCMTKLLPRCPNLKPEELKSIIEEKFNIPVIIGTHNY